MKLSEAILLGATMENPGNMGGGNLKCGLPHTTDTRCALELALIAVGRPELHWERATLLWPWIQNVYHFTSVWDSAYLGKRMSLEAYVDWVRSVEPCEPADLPKPVPAPPAEQNAEALQTVPGPNLKL